MNPEYEYVLPTQVARLMAGTTCASNDIATQEHEQARPFYSRAGGRRGSIQEFQLPMLAATQPLDVTSFQMGPSITDYSSGSDPGDRSALGSRTTPISSIRRESYQHVLETHSGACGDTTVVAPYTLRSSSTCLQTRHIQDDTISQVCMASTVSTCAKRTLQLPLPLEQHGDEIQPGPPAYTVWAHGMTGDGTHKQGRRRWQWLRSWLPRSSPTTPPCSTIGAEQTAEQLLVRLQRQLDGFCSGDLFLGRFEMLGAHSRRRGGVLTSYFTPLPRLVSRAPACLIECASMGDNTVGCVRL